ncbi:mucin-binding protein [Fructobacillus parabroussonetiae]|uniref:Mub B2-like domain-containing protein n=1 Tax=Fructobacillus parabroussonetiae TaxID=2713174 RepID=A0ABS5QVG2_9LACO|nr:hypothetical protein [Fructobacillus parabroussonetiae]MBS9337189.1 hypothetical protein [Fructobacillus parabroussonetiae]
MNLKSKTTAQPSASKLNRTIHYQDAAGHAIDGLLDEVQSVTRTITKHMSDFDNQQVGPDEVSTDRSWEAVPVDSVTADKKYRVKEILDGQGNVLNSDTIPAQTDFDENTTDSKYTVVYEDNVQSFGPEDANLPSAVDKSQLTKTLSRTVQSVDDNENQKEISSKTEQVKYQRQAIYDYATEKVTGYTDWQPVDANQPGFEKEDIPETIQDGQYQQATSQADSLAADTTSQDDISNGNNPATVVLHYVHVQKPVDTSTDAKDTTRTVKRIVHLRDANKGQEIDADNLASRTVTVNYTRTGTMDQVTKAFTPTSGWQAEQNMTTLAGFTAPDLTKEGYESPAPSQTAALTPSEDEVETSKVYDQWIDYQEKVDTFSADSQSLPTGVTKVDLQKSATRTFHFKSADGQQDFGQDTQTVTFTRTAQYNEVTKQVTYGDWQADAQSKGNFVAYNWPESQADGKYVLAENSAKQTPAESLNPDSVTAGQNEDVTVLYEHAHLQAPDEQLKRTVTRTIHLQVAGTGAKAGDNLVSAIHYHRTGYVDAVKNVFVSESGWVKDDGQEDFGQVTAPDLSQAGYENPDPADVPAINLSQDDHDIDQNKNFEQTVVYTEKAQDFGPNDANLPAGVNASDLTKTVQRTIHFKDEDDANAKELGQLTQTITYSRKALFNLAKKQVDGYTPWVADASSNGRFAAYSPEAKLSDGRYVLASQAVSEESPDAQTVVNGTVENVTVNYRHAHLEASDDQLKRTVSRIVHLYDQKSGQEIDQAHLADRTATLIYERSGYVDAVTSDFVKTSDWQLIAGEQPVISGLKAPDLSADNYQLTGKSVTADITPSETDIEQNKTFDQRLDYVQKTPEGDGGKGNNPDRQPNGDSGNNPDNQSNNGQDVKPNGQPADSSNEPSRTDTGANANQVAGNGDGALAGTALRTTMAQAGARADIAAAQAKENAEEQAAIRRSKESSKVSQGKRATNQDKHSKGQSASKHGKRIKPTGESKKTTGGASRKQTLSLAAATILPVTVIAYFILKERK